MGNSLPLPIPNANEAKAISDSYDDPYYYRNYVDCTYKIANAIKNGKHCAYCVYMEPKFDQILREKGYDVRYERVEHKYIGPKYYAVV